ncbi:MAG: deoxyribonuclease [Burkholderiaceae bacterium]|nr:MAG: deoxyribonuclease [Burkholderiaceae bacterium]
MSSKTQVDLGSLQVSERDAISEAIEKDSVAFIGEIKIPRKTKKRVTATLVIIFAIVSGVAYAGPNESFSKSKKQLKTIYQNHQTTFYCNCKYDYQDKSDMIDNSSCRYVPRKPNTRSKRIEWEHVVPAENFGRQFACWRDGSPSCVKSNGKQYKGRMCCTKVSQDYRIMQADMHNLVPAIGELNGDRSNYRYDFELPKLKQYGACEFEVLFKERRARVKKDIRGNVARTYLYMNDRYGMKLSKQEQKKFNAWNNEDPVDAWESERNMRIQKIQGNLNNYIKRRVL